ncbi:MAG: YfiR/HmsC family protein [Thiovulaceae bacterium]|nr:YfiR/HmsC family protein [Sulfurimonadaceae bacterium]
MLVKFVKVLLLFAFLFNTTMVSATDYDEDVLEIFSKLLPRFVIMSDQKLKVKDQINICVVHEDIEKGTASSLIEKTIHNYPQGIKNYNIKLIQTDFTNLSMCKNSELFFLFNSSEKNIIETLLFAKKQKILTVSYDASLLENGIEVSLFLGRKILPYINVNALKRNGIIVDPILLRISKIYMQTDK